MLKIAEPVGFCLSSRLRCWAVSRLASGIKGYTQWREALWTDQTLRAEAKRCAYDPRTVAEVIGLRGVNGRYCNISATRVAERIGCSMNTVKTHRTLLTRLGWFTATGRYSRRLELLSISLPEPIDQQQPLIDHWGIPIDQPRFVSYQIQALIR